MSGLVKQLLEKRTKIEKTVVLELCQKAKVEFSKLKNVIWIEDIPKEGFVVVGDLHGQDVDLLHILRTNENKTFLFLGDYIDRGYQSLRIVILLLSLFLESPKRFHMLRGNHEAKKISEIYGFFEECKKVYGEEDGKEVWDAVMECLAWTPLAAVVNKKYFCCHAGISPKFYDKKIECLDNIDRSHVDLVEDAENACKYEKEEDSIEIIDILWSDPDDKASGFQSSPRGCGWVYGPDVTKKFLEVNGFELMIRSHQLVMEGAKYCHDGKVLTLFSASNYCARCGNQGGIALISEDGIKAVTHMVHLGLNERISEIRKQMYSGMDLEVKVEEVQEVMEMLETQYTENKKFLDSVLEKLKKKEE